MISSNKEWGPGRWQSIHVTAASSVTSQKFRIFCEWIRDQIDHLPCSECTDHAKEYLEHNPPEKSEDAFIWTWRFHNTVNRRLDKPEMEYTTAKQIYLEGGLKVCSEGCDEGKKKEADKLKYRTSRT